MEKSLGWWTPSGSPTFLILSLDLIQMLPLRYVASLYLLVLHAKRKKRKENIYPARGGGEKWKGCGVAAKFVSCPISHSMAFYRRITSLSGSGKWSVNNSILAV